jgi:hypothetical protein
MGVMGQPWRCAYLPERHSRDAETLHHFLLPMNHCTLRSFER